MRLFVCLFLLTISLFACQSDQSATGTTAVPEPSAPATASVPKASATGTSDALQQKQPLSAYAQQHFATQYWHYDAAVVLNDFEKGKEYYGKWVKLNPDHTLETGFYDGPVTAGRWTLDEETDIITIVEEGEQPTYSEWKVKTSSSSDAIMIWVGTSRFGQNNTQIKMLKYSGKPSRK